MLECEPRESTGNAAHIRLTTFCNLPKHYTSSVKADFISTAPPIYYQNKKSTIEICTREALGDKLLTALELDIKSTGNSERNTIEVVFAGLGFIAIGGNFARAKVRISTPEGRGVGIRRPLVARINNGDSLPVTGKGGGMRTKRRGVRLGELLEAVGGEAALEGSA